jgi:glycine oxidase
VIIVGAGVIGLACAWRAARSGLRVRVIEREEPGAGASGVAAGMIAPAGEAVWGEEQQVAVAVRAAEAWPDFAAELADDCGQDTSYRRLGALHVALDRDEGEELRRRFDLLRSLELAAEWRRPSDCRRLEAGLSPSLAGGIEAPGEAAVDPRELLRCLRIAVETKGGEIAGRCEVVAAQIADGRLVGVRTDDGREHRAPRVVLACGAWSGVARWLPAEARPPIRPVKGQILMLGGSQDEPLCGRLIVTERVYLVPRGDGRVVVGATVEEQGFDMRVTAGGVHELLREAYRALPEVAELELLETAAGLRPGTPDNAPLVGDGELEGLILATGHWRNGVLLAPWTADAVVEMITGTRQEAGR